MSLNLSSIIFSLVLSSTPNADPMVLVLTTGQTVRCQSYEVRGNAIHIVAEDGTPQIMRSERVDLLASRIRTNALRAQLAREAEVLAAAEQAAALDAERLAAERERTSEARQRRTKARAGGGSLSTIGGSDGGSESAEYSPAIAPTTGTGTADSDHVSRLRALRDQYTTAISRLASITREHNDLVRTHNNTTNGPERSVLQTQIADIRGRMEATRKDIEITRSAFEIVREAARLARVDGVHRRPLDASNPLGDSRVLEPQALP
jgi:hypothetical protein